ncbi:hypothetical protein F6U93_12845 [Tamlana haliotis]|uniref:TonB-dependent receptor n=1 Tax=Pseudotamlana haliotis TaxID=2614804 RepID=A0A6N6MGN3_9FLAO|nr:carboxypeptidase regulatory-like domain-containing protein [Tamlana haliotis]KAB1067294.1 hypothetical protein F6U93_12845 [Tamlana haliotis]
MTRILYTLLFMSLCSSVWSQEASIQGNIINHNTKEPVAGARILIKDSEIAQQSNEAGEFLIEHHIPLGKITVFIEMKGYSSRKFDVDILEGKRATIKNIILYPRKSPDSTEAELQLHGTSLTGIVTHKQKKTAIAGARVNIVDAYMTTLTDDTGRFVFNNNVPEGPIVLKVSKDNYSTKTYNVFISPGKIANIDGITLGNDLYDIENQQINTYAEDQLYTDHETLTNNSAFYQGSNNTFLNTAAYQFSPAFFKARGQDAIEGDVMINGVRYNSPLNGEADWNAIGGLDDVFQDSDLSYGLTASKYSLGGHLGSLNMNTRASSQREGGKITYLSSNRRYAHGLQATYATGVSPKGFSLAVSASKRTAFTEGYFDGTPYDSNSFYISAETRINSSSILNFTGFFNNTNRAERAANTNEVFNLKDHKYNSYWGDIKDDIKNSKEQNSYQPFLMLNYYLNLGARVKLQTNLAYNFGSSSRSRIDYHGASIDGSNQIIPSTAENPNPSYYTKLPSYFLADANNPDYEGAVLAQESFQQNGQIDWRDLMQYNFNSGFKTATYTLYDHVVDHSNFRANIIADIYLNKKLSLNAAFRYSNNTTHHYAQMNSTLAGAAYLDVNTADGTGDAVQSDLLHPNRFVQDGDTFRYNYDLKHTAYNGFVQVQFHKNNLDAFLGADITHASNHRVGYYQNGHSPYLSYGTGRNYTFLDYNFKGGLDLQINPKHKFGVRAFYGKNAPVLNHMFLNAKESDNPVDFQGISTISELNQSPELIAINSVKSFSAELKYNYESTLFKAEITGYYNTHTDGMSNRPFVSNQINNYSASTIQEVLSNIDKRYMGLEFGASYQVLKSIRLKTAVAMGDFRYTDNPELAYVISESEVLSLGEVHLKDYRVSNTPSQAFALGFEYRDEDDWWFEATGNFFANHYIDINPYFRTRDFTLDSNGDLFSNYNPKNAAILLKQDRLENYFSLNLFGGKYWRIKTNHIGFKAGINNALGQNHDIASFETPGQLKYDSLLEDAKRQHPIYGNRYWKGYGATSFVNIYYRF